MSKQHRFDHRDFLVQPGERIRLADADPEFTAGIKDKAAAQAALIEDVSALADAQELLWASADRAVLIIFQALDAAGKDGTIKHVMSGVNPQGCEVHSFKAPTEEERLRHFLWRPARVLPARGRIAIFNRSYYEEVLVVRVHPEFLDKQWTPPELRNQDLSETWQRRYDEINRFEKGLTDNGIEIIKFFLNISKREQKKRFLDRIDDPRKHWKFFPADIIERAHWKTYLHAYEDMLTATSTDRAPWYVIPADHKWFTRAVVADIIAARIHALDLHPPQPNAATVAELAEMRARLESEPD